MNIYHPCAELIFISMIILPPTQAPVCHEKLIMIEATGDFAQNSQYVTDHQISTDIYTPEHSGSKD